MLKWFAVKVLNIQFRPDLMKWFALKSLNINFVHICHRWHHHYFLLETDFDRQMQDPKNFLKAAKAHKIPDRHFSRIRVWKGPLIQLSPQRSTPLAWLTCSSPIVACYQVNKEAIQTENQIEANSTIFNPIIQVSQVFPKIWLPASLENLRSSPPLCNAQRFKVVSESLSTGPNWSHFLSLLIPNNYKSEMH